MMELTPRQKGDALEKAVRAIEEVILRSAPSYSEDTFKIERKKVTEVAGVRHEIDIFVTVAHAPGYEAIFLFECKNWEEKVSKNEIIIFAEKVRALNAQRGFFVAKSFSKDAIAQAEREPRIELLFAEALDPSAVMFPGGYHGIQVGKVDPNLRVVVKKAHINDPRRRPADMATTRFVLDGVTVDLKAYRDAWALEARDRASENFVPTPPDDEGLRLVEFSEERTFSEGQALLDGYAVLRMSLTGTVEVHVIKAVVTSAFDVATRGRFIDTQIAWPDGTGPTEIGFVLE